MNSSEIEWKFHENSIPKYVADGLRNSVNVKIHDVIKKGMQEEIFHHATLFWGQFFLRVKTSSRFSHESHKMKYDDNKVIASHVPNLYLLNFTVWFWQWNAQIFQVIRMSYIITYFEPNLHSKCFEYFDTPNFFCLVFYSLVFHCNLFCFISFHLLLFLSFSFHSFPFHSFLLLSAPFRSILLHYTPFHSILLHFAPFHSFSLHSNPFHFI